MKSDAARIREWRKRNPEKVREAYQRRKEAVKNAAKQWRIDNPEKWKKIRRNYYQKRVSKDQLYYFTLRIRSLVRVGIRQQGFKKNSKTGALLGIDFKTLLPLLWDNFELKYGLPRNLVGLEQVHIDHIIPLSSATSIEELERLNHYTNLQFLLIEDNLSKGARIE